jgi:anti-sigma factor RsiW
MRAWTCEEARARLDDFVDGLLDAAEREQMAEHLRGCAGCAREEAALRALLARAAALPAEVPPPADLWPGIERRLSAAPASGTWLRYLAAAACVAVALAGALSARVPRAADQARAGAIAQGALQPVALQAAEVDQVERDYEQAAAALLEKVRARQDELPPQTVQKVEESLRTIDAALGQIRAALRQQPADPALHLMLAATHRKKVEVLRRVVEVGA